VVRWFFHAGKAAGTIAKTISAYDMAISDGIYGPTERYVSRQRLEAMLDHEFKPGGAPGSDSRRAHLLLRFRGYLRHANAFASPRGT
jgi:hypothetical protein